MLHDLEVIDTDKCIKLYKNKVKYRKNATANTNYYIVVNLCIHY